MLPRTTGREAACYRLDPKVRQVPLLAEGALIPVPRALLQPSFTACPGLGCETHLGRAVFVDVLADEARNVGGHQ